MEQQKIKHLIYCPFTGLGLHNGFRGNRWLKNRIAIFKQFVIPSLKHQTSQNFILWISWRREEKHNKIVQEFVRDLKIEFGPNKVLHTYAGICFYDDKYSDEIAQNRLIIALHDSLSDLLNVIGECDYILMTIQPSDDLYHYQAVEGIQKFFENHPEFQAVGFKKGYICNYNTMEVAEYNPDTNPPFYTVKFPRNVFIDPLSHANYTALKTDSGKYKKGTPCPSHEYIPQCLKYAIIGDLRGFLVGTHGVNISTTYNIPYKGVPVEKEILRDFGIFDGLPLQIKVSFLKKLLLRLPFKVQRKLRYWLSEKFKINILS